MNKEDGQIMHRPIAASWRNPQNVRELPFRHAQAILSQARASEDVTEVNGLL